MSDSYSIMYSLKSMEDLFDIYSYIAYSLLVPSTAEGQVSRIRNAIRSLEFLPTRYSVVEFTHILAPKMHKLPVDNFNVFYTVDASQHIVTIIRILYSGRDIADIIYET